MIITYKTKINKNGNSYGLKVNHENKTFCAGYFLINGSPDIRATKTEINNLKDILLNNGYILQNKYF